MHGALFPNRDYTCYNWGNAYNIQDISSYHNHNWHSKCYQSCSSISNQKHSNNTPCCTEPLRSGYGVWPEYQISTPSLTRVFQRKKYILWSFSRYTRYSFSTRKIGSWFLINCFSSNNNFEKTVGKSLVRNWSTICGFEKHVHGQSIQCSVNSG